MSNSVNYKAFIFIKDEFSVVNPILSITDIDFTFISNIENFEFSIPYPDIIICVSDWQYEIAKIIFQARKLRIPSLMLQDGTLDWIIQNEGDLYGGNGGATHYNPVLTDKIAVIGQQSARFVSHWSSAQQVEVVGFPKLENLILKSRLDDSSNTNLDLKSKNTLTVLITSTRQGWFSQDHKSHVVNALIDLKKYFQVHDSYNVIWRLSRNLSNIIGVKNDLYEKNSEELSVLIKKADFVISFQSTVVLESMLLGKPVAIIDYSNSPQYYNTAWFISHKSQIENIVRLMSRPDAARLQFQEYQLIDILFIEESSINRVGELIHKMVNHRRVYDNTMFPSNLLQYNGVFDFSTRISYQEVYPKVKEFKLTNVEELQLLLTRKNNASRKVLNKFKVISKSILFRLKLLLWKRH